MSDTKLSHIEHPNPGDETPGSPENPSGVMLLVEEQEALIARLALAASAKETIDVQYYIWTGDAVGIAVLEELLLAALRGVRVRLLVDDIHFVGYDRRVLGLDAYDNVEIRAFNPLRYRFRNAPFRSMFEVISGVARLNHRMHNKVFAVDGAAAIVGGRNLSNEYFGADPSFNFRDVDVLTTGPAVTEIMHSFDDYWTSEWAVPLAELHKRRIKPVVLDALENGLSAYDRELLARIRALPTEHYLASIQSDINKCHVEVLVDAPEKMKGEDDIVSPLRQRLFELNATAKQEVLIENGYFIPRDEGLQRLKTQVDKGVEIKVLTNSLASNDTGLSHAGYQRYREDLLRDGVQLYELRRDAAFAQELELGPRSATNIGLHSKAAVIDRQVAFVGSYNLDPRSAFINTEIGVVIHHEGVAQQLADAILQAMHQNNSWSLELLPTGRIQWQHNSIVGGEPAASWRKKLIARILSLLPLEHQL